MMRWRCSNGGADVMIMVRGYGGCANVSGCGSWGCRCSNGGRVGVSNGGNCCGGDCNNGGCDCGGDGGVRLVVAMSRWWSFCERKCVCEGYKTSLLKTNECITKI